MTRTYKAPKITARWNKDLSVSLYARGKLVQKIPYRTWADPREHAEAFMDGWFDGEPHRVRWVYA